MFVHETMKKILMVCEAFGGGVFTYVSQLCNDMSDDFDVYLAYSLRPQTPENYKDFLNKKIHLIEVKSWQNKSIINILNDLRVIRELRQIEKEISPNIIHLHSSIAGGIGRIAFSGKNNTLIYTPHEYAHVLMGKGIKSKMYGMMEWILGKKNCITLTCCESEDEVAKTLCKRTAYIETGINIEEFDSILNDVEPVKKDGFTVFTMGRACIQKQPAFFSQIAQLVPEAHFVWIGDGELVNQLKNVEVTGWLSRKKALARAKGADVFILCSRGEAVAMSLIENMYMKKLVLVSDVMGNKSVVQNGINGYICTTAGEYAVKIKAAMKNFPIDVASRAFQDVIKKYNAEVMKKRFVDYYNAIG